MAKIHDMFVIELAEVIKGYGNNPDIDDPFSLSTFYRFYELPNIAISLDNFKKMKPYEQPQRKTGQWLPGRDRDYNECSVCRRITEPQVVAYKFCPYCGASMTN